MRCCHTPIATKENRGFLQALAAWLVASPANAVLALGATSLFQLTQVVGGIFLAAIAVVRGLRFATICALLAAGTLALFAMILGVSWTAVLQILATVWLPVYLLIVIWQSAKSTMLALQLSLILTAAGLLVFNLVVDDLDAFWLPILQKSDAAFTQAGFSSPLAALESRLADTPMSIGDVAMMGIVAVNWLLAVLQFQLGGALGSMAPGETGQFGRFRMIDFGRVLAIAFGIAVAASLLLKVAVIGQIVFLFMTAFLLQGFAVVHWLHGEGHVPVFVVIVMYATAVVLPDYVLMTLAVIGVSDATFRLRRRLTEVKGSEQ